MCPDDSILSCYFDGEIEQKWRTQIENHLSTCAECQEKLNTYKRVQHALIDNGEPDYHQSMMRVAERVELSSTVQTAIGSPRKKHQLVLPIPLAVAASICALVLGFLIAVVTQRSNLRTLQITREPSGTTFEVAAPLKDLEQLIKSLANESKREIVIQLPELPRESVFFMVNDEPKFLRETEIMGDRR